MVLIDGEKIKIEEEEIREQREEKGGDEGGKEEMHVEA